MCQAPMRDSSERVGLMLGSTSGAVRWHRAVPPGFHLQAPRHSVGRANAGLQGRRGAVQSSFAHGRPAEGDTVPFVTSDGAPALGSP